MKILALQVLKTQVLIRGLLLYLIWLRFEETGKIMEEPTRKTVDPFRLFIQCKAGTFASEKNAFFPKRGKKDDLALVSSRQRA